MPNCYFTPLIVCNYLSCWIILQELAATFCILIQCKWSVYWDAKINWGTKISYVNIDLAYMSIIDNKYFQPTLYNGCNKLSILGLTHWGRVMHICVSDLTIIVSDNALSPERRQTIIWINAGILLIGPIGMNFNGILIEIHTFSFKKIHLKMLSGECRPFCLGLDVLNSIHVSVPIVCVTVWLRTSCRKLCSRQVPTIREKYIRSKWEILAFQG